MTRWRRLFGRWLCLRCDRWAGSQVYCKRCRKADEMLRVVREREQAEEFRRHRELQRIRIAQHRSGR